MIETFSDFGRKIVGRVVKLHSVSPEELFGEKLLLRELCHFFSDFEQKLFDGIVKTAVYVSRGTFWVLKKKRDHVYSELGSSEEESLHTEGMILLS